MPTPRKGTDFVPFVARPDEVDPREHRRDVRIAGDDRAARSAFGIANSSVASSALPTARWSTTWRWPIGRIVPSLQRRRRTVR
jgi:hypothetical protein